MTPKQEKYLTEKYIRPMVKKMIKEGNIPDDIQEDIRDEIQIIIVQSNFIKNRAVMDSDTVKKYITILNKKIEKIEDILNRV